MVAAISNHLAILSAMVLPFEVVKQVVLHFLAWCALPTLVSLDRDFQCLAQCQCEQRLLARSSIAFRNQLVESTESMREIYV